LFLNNNLVCYHFNKFTNSKRNLTIFCIIFLTAIWLSPSSMRSPSIMFTKAYSISEKNTNTVQLDMKTSIAWNENTKTHVSYLACVQSQQMAVFFKGSASSAMCTTTTTRFTLYLMCFLTNRFLHSKQGGILLPIGAPRHLQRVINPDQSVNKIAHVTLANRARRTFAWKLLLSKKKFYISDNFVSETALF
jgi:hypothetical protein